MRASAQAVENPYDLLGRVLVPLASIFSPENPNQALTAVLTLEQADGVPAEFLGKMLEINLQPPEQASVKADFKGTPVTLCRSGREVWVTPGTLADPWISMLENQPLPKKKHRGTGLPVMALPFPPKQLVFLPVLFQVEDGGTENGLRVLRVRLMRELARQVGAEAWSARLWVTEAGALARLEISRPGWKAAARVDSLQLSKSLPPETWVPQGGDVTYVPGSKIASWLHAHTALGRD